MKKILPIFFFILCIFGRAQEKFILKDAQNGKEFVKKDSLSAVKFLDSLAQNNFYFTKILSVEKQNLDTKILFDKGKNYNQAQVKISDSLAKAFKIQPQFFTKNLDSLKHDINQRYIGQGFPFSRVKSRFTGIKNDIPTVEISVIKDRLRSIDAFVMKGYSKAPARFRKNLDKDFVRKTYTEQNLAAIGRQLENHPFVALERPPQTLFTKDSTTVYLFLQKKKVNIFDGVIGFGNDKNQKFSFTGNLNVQFRNLFNGFESIALSWQRSPDRSQTFDLHTDIPYLFGSAVGMEFRANIFRQDSAYASVRLMPAAYYHLGRNQRMGVRGTFESSVVLDSLQTNMRDFTRKGIGLWYDYSNTGDIALFVFKTKIRAEADAVATDYGKNGGKLQQMRYFAAAEHNMNLAGNHWLNLKAESAFIDAKAALSVNEMLRFGGWNSMRGFSENSLYADFYYFGGAEYRYLIGRQAFFDIFGQYGQLKNSAASLSPKLYSFGAGFNFFLPIGLMSFQISSGNQPGSPIKLGDTKIHWGILSRF